MCVVAAAVTLIMTGCKQSAVAPRLIEAFFTYDDMTGIHDTSKVTHAEKIVLSKSAKNLKYVTFVTAIDDPNYDTVTIISELNGNQLHYPISEQSYNPQLTYWNHDYFIGIPGTGNFKIYALDAEGHKSNEITFTVEFVEE